MFHYYKHSRGTHFLKRTLVRQGIENRGCLIGVLCRSEDFSDFTREGKWHLITGSIPTPLAGSQQAGNGREWVGVIGHDPEGVPINQYRHCAPLYEVDQVCKKSGATAANDMCPPIGPEPSSSRFLTGENV